MNTSAVRTSESRINWIGVSDVLKKVGPLVFCLVAGGWIQSAIDHASDLPYKDRSTAQLEQVKRVAGANPVAAVKCLKRQAAVATDTAALAVAAATDKDGYPPVPNLEKIPDCPPTPVATAPQPKPPRSIFRK